MCGIDSEVPKPAMELLSTDAKVPYYEIPLNDRDPSKFALCITPGQGSNNRKYKVNVYATETSSNSFGWFETIIMIGVGLAATWLFLKPSK